MSYNRHKILLNKNVPIFMDVAEGGRRTVPRKHRFFEIRKHRFFEIFFVCVGSKLGIDGNSGCLGGKLIHDKRGDGDSFAFVQKRFCLRTFQQTTNVRIRLIMSMKQFPISRFAFYLLLRPWRRRNCHADVLLNLKKENIETGGISMQVWTRRIMIRVHAVVCKSLQF